MLSLPRRAQLYIGCVAALALAVIVQTPWRPIDWPTLVVLALLFYICESVATLLPGDGRVHVSVSFSATLACVVLVGPVGAALLGTLTAIALRRKGLPLVKRAFNGAQLCLSAYLAGVAYQLLGGPAGVPTNGEFLHVLMPFTVAVLTYVLVNSLLVACVVLVTQGLPGIQAHVGALAHAIVPYTGYGMFGLLIAALWGAVGGFAALMVLLPLFVARWAFTQHAAQRAAHDSTIAALCQAVETKDYYTRGHSERVSKASVLIAREIGMRGARVEALRYAGMLHDVGKLGVPTKVLQKPGSLSEEEFAAIQLHPMRGLEIVREIGFLDEALAGIMHHHERMDGRGYPMGLTAGEIPQFARVISVADAFDSMTSTRSYRNARSVEEAIVELQRWSGKQFDTTMVDALVRAVEREGWQPSILDAPASDEAAETAHQDHDDPSAPLRVTERESP